MLERLFRLSEHGTTARREVVAGLTTFVTVSYILVVHPQLLAAAGMPFDAVLFATCVSAAFGSAFMGLVARYPIVLAPGMGLNAYFSLVVVPLIAKSGYASPELAWRAALGCVFISGVLFVLLSVIKVREMIVDAVPIALKVAISAGIGLFIALIGFQQGGLIKTHPATMLTLGDIGSPQALLTIGGLLLTAGLLAREVKSAMLWSMLVVTLAALPLGLAKLPAQIVALPQPSATFLALDIPGALHAGLAVLAFTIHFILLSTENYNWLS